MDHYFKTLGLATASWHFSQPKALLADLVAQASTIFLLVPDKKIADVYSQHLDFFQSKAGRIYHCSGSVHHPGVRSLHPLMTFPKALFPDSFYPQITFTSTDDFSWSEIDSRIKNPVIKIAKEQQAMYHAQCVLAANMTHILWINFHDEMEKMGFQSSNLKPYIERISENYLNLGCQALTGPLVRNDQDTINKNLEALDGDPFHEIYESFVAAYQKKISQVRNS